MLSFRGRHLAIKCVCSKFQEHTRCGFWTSPCSQFGLTSLRRLTRDLKIIIVSAFAIPFGPLLFAHGDLRSYITISHRMFILRRGFPTSWWALLGGGQREGPNWDSVYVGLMGPKRNRTRWHPYWAGHLWTTSTVVCILGQGDILKAYTEGYGGQFCSYTWMWWTFFSPPSVHLPSCTRKVSSSLEQSLAHHLPSWTCPILIQCIPPLPLLALSCVAFLFPGIWKVIHTLLFFFSSELNSSLFSMEHRHLLIHDMDRSCLPQHVHQLGSLDEYRCWLFSNLVRHLWVLICVHTPGSLLIELSLATKFFIGATVAIPAASLCINRRLYHISSVRSVTITKAEKRRNVMVDLAIGLGIPVLEMILRTWLHYVLCYFCVLISLLDYIPQGHRYNIFEDIGCLPSTYNTWVAYVLVYCVPIAIGCVSAVYAFLSIKNFNKSRLQFNDLLSSYNNLTSSRYVRLMCLAATELLLTLPLGSFSIYLNVRAGISPWISWADTHFGFSRVDQTLAIYWRMDPTNNISLELTRWLPIFCAFVFFGFFGFADEARKNYRSVFETVVKRVGITTSSIGSKTAFTSTGSKSVGSDVKVRPAAPVFVHQEFLRRQSSMDSFSDMSLSIADVSGHLDEKKDGEKDSEKGVEAFMPTLSYGQISFADVGGTLADYKPGLYSPTPSSGASSASSIASPEPALTRSSSLHSLPSSPVVDATTAQKAHTHDIVWFPLSLKFVLGFGFDLFAVCDLFFPIILSDKDTPPSHLLVTFTPSDAFLSLLYQYWVPHHHCSISIFFLLFLSLSMDRTISILDVHRHLLLAIIGQLHAMI